MNSTDAPHREIERRFLIDPASLASLVDGLPAETLRQFYLTTGQVPSIRVRLGAHGWSMAVKGKRHGAERTEHEIPLAGGDGEALATFAAGVPLAKRRYRRPLGSLVAEIDVYEGCLAGLVVCEIELPDPATPIPEAAWLGPEITDDRRFDNARLALLADPRAILCAAAGMLARTTECSA